MGGFAPEYRNPLGTECCRYYKEAGLTEKVLNKDGWFHTGDIGEQTPAEALKIIDRKKEVSLTPCSSNLTLSSSNLNLSPFLRLLV